MIAKENFVDEHTVPPFQRSPELTLSKEAIKDLQPSVNFVNENGRNFILYLEASTGKVRAYRNECQHQGGRFVRDIEDSSKDSVVKCSRHGWKLNCKTGAYVNPPGCKFQPELRIETGADGELLFFDDNMQQPWLTDSRLPEHLSRGELSITYFTHACVRLNAGDKVIFTDPWCEGPAFARGWWLKHAPPATWLEEISNCSMIWISHAHSDHLSIPTLAKIAKKNPDVPIVVADLPSNVLPRDFDRLGFRDVRITPVNAWVELDEHLRFMIMKDGCFEDLDTCILFDYKGHLVMNTVDCASPNNFVLPSKVDVLLTDFAGAASGFPVVMEGGRYTDEFITSYVRRNLKNCLVKTADLAKKTQPQLYIPFAGYFTAAHPSDSRIREMNRANVPEDACAIVSRSCPDALTWVPFPGGTIDICSESGSPERIEASLPVKPYDGEPPFPEWNFDEYINMLKEDISFEPFKHNRTAAFKAYFEWVGFSEYDLVLELIETDDDFNPLYEPFFVDFLDLSFPSARPHGRNYKRAKVRTDVLRHTMRHGKSWDDIFIGFNCRLHRDPDVYHFKFWNKMYTGLPKNAPDWPRLLFERKKCLD